MKSIIAALIIAFVWVRPGLACSCRPLTLDERMNLADVVFVGKVMDVPGKTVIAVSGYWIDRRSSFKKTVIVRGYSSNTEFNSCDIPFNTGEPYLIFGVLKNDEVRTDICAGTRPVKHATEDLVKLGPPTPPK